MFKVPKRFLQRSFSVCVKLIRGTYSIFSSVPSWTAWQSLCVRFIRRNSIQLCYIMYAAITRRLQLELVGAMSLPIYTSIHFCQLTSHCLGVIDTNSHKQIHNTEGSVATHAFRVASVKYTDIRWTSSSFQLLLFLFWFSCIPVVFVNVYKDILVCCKRDQTSHTSTYYQEMAELVVVFSKITQFQIHTSRSSAIHECFVIVVRFVSNRIAWEVLPILDRFHGTDTPM